MPEQEQLGRLQHLLHMLELCAMQSSNSEFNSPAWHCARNYSDRIFQDLDSGSTHWSQIGPKMHPTNMMQAMALHPKVIPTFKAEKLKTAGAQPEAPPGPVCPKWLLVKSKINANGKLITLAVPVIVPITALSVKRSLSN